MSVEESEELGETPDPYENGQKNKVIDLFLGIFLVSGEIFGFYIWNEINFYTSSDLLDWILNSGASWMIGFFIILILDITLIIRWAKRKRYFLIGGMVALPFLWIYYVS